MNFNPMLSRDFGSADVERWPEQGMLISQKYDGIRVIIRNNEVYTRSGKLLQNRAIAKVLKSLPDGFDGEIVPNDFFAKNCFQQATTLAMTQVEQTQPLPESMSHWRYVIFNYFGDDSEEFRSKPYAHRMALGGAFLKDAQGLHAELREHVRMAELAKVMTYAQAKAWTDAIVWLGAEGAMLAHAEAPYLHARCKNSETWSLKLKPMARCEAEVIGFKPAVHASQKSIGDGTHGTAKAELGSLLLRMADGTTFACGTGFSQEQRLTIWQNQQDYLGLQASIDYLPAGSKQAPRHPVFKGWRNKADM